MPYNWVANEPDDLPRNIAAAATGILSVPLGITVLALVVGAGLAVQLVAEDKLPAGAKHPLAGVVDGGAAILGRLAIV